MVFCMFAPLVRLRMSRSSFFLAVCVIWVVVVVVVGDDDGDDDDEFAFLRKDGLLR